jgi:hypothetical protein
LATFNQKEKRNPKPPVNLSTAYVNHRKKAKIIVS